MSKISNFFTISEATKSDTAKKKNIPNIPNEQQLLNIKKASIRLDLFRFLVAKPFIVNSWFRSVELNNVIGGVMTSQHLTGFAIDFTVGGSVKEVFHIIKLSGLSFDQLIYYPKKNFIHISFKENIETERKQVLIKE